MSLLLPYAHSAHHAKRTLFYNPPPVGHPLQSLSLTLAPRTDPPTGLRSRH
jgi:hypothetical protein